MAVIGQVLVQFVFRLTFGMALAMACTPARLVTSGYYRVHLWVLMGLNTFAALAVLSGQSEPTGLVPARITGGLAIGLAVLSYVGAVVWLYEQSRWGRRLLLLVACLALGAAVLDSRWPPSSQWAAMALVAGTIVTSGLVLGVTMAGMLLGHWYLNTPGMALLPLERLTRVMALSVLGRAAVSAIGVGLGWQAIGASNTFFAMFLAFRWLAGLLGPLAMAWLARQTLKIPNTQSATGILYAGVILVFLGELIAQLLSADTLFPV